MTSCGYGVYIDTGRYVAMYTGYQRKIRRHTEGETSSIAISTDELYSSRKESVADAYVLADIPVAKGVDIYIFQGDTISDAVSQYNLFSGGGCMPSLWGLGMLYRCFAHSPQHQVIEMADYFRSHNLPCDIIGLEPGWQTNSYSCSYVWNSEKFPNPGEMLDDLKTKGFHVNLWEHAFVHPSSPIYESLYSHSGDFEVWNGLVPDFALEKAGEIFSDYHRREFTDKGITGFKLDECDGSDYVGSWSFPNCAAFPSGLDGEQMHSLFGVLYQRTMLKALGNVRTLSQVRNSHACAAPYPFVLYSDLYDHSDFIRRSVNAGFSGLLWTPELRHAISREDLIRRMQSLVFSPQALINAWYIEDGTPWDEFGAEDEVRKLMECRMSLIPYLYAAFYQYYKEGIPPVRALVCDFTDDAETYYIDNEYMYGQSMLVAPMVTGEHTRRVYLPEGVWYDYWTGDKYQCGWHDITSENIPVFVRDNCIIPVAKPLQCINEDTVFELELRCYGSHGSCKLIEDDGVTYTSDFKELSVDFKGDLPENSRYIVSNIRFIC